MRATSENWNRLLNGYHNVQYRVVIAGTTYDMDRLVSVRVTYPLFDKFSIGNCCSAQLTVTLIPDEEVPRMSQVELYMRLVNQNDSSDYSEWIPKGVFFIDTREINSIGDVTFTCYDAMLKAEAVYLITDETQNEAEENTGEPETAGEGTGEGTGEPSELDEFPKPMDDALDEICERMGVTLDSNSAFVYGGYFVEYPNDLTIREVLGYIAVANGGNFIMTDEGKLKLVHLVQPLNGVDVGRDIMNFTHSPALPTVSGVVLWWADEEAYQAGDDSGYVLSADCEWATQQMADSVLRMLSHYSYVPYTANAANMNPAMEIGDVITVNGITSIIACWDISSSGVSDISAPYDEEIDHEYPYLGEYSKALKRTVKLGQPYYGTKITRKEGLKIVLTDGTNEFAEAVFNANTLSMRALVDGVMTDCVYFDTTTGRYKITGTTMVDGAIITEAVYADQGDIGWLTVDRIDTSRRVARYLNGNTSDEHHFVGQEMQFDFVISSVLFDDSSEGEETGENGEGEETRIPLEEQLTDRRGALLFWEKDISEATITDGYPHVDGERVYITRKDTGFPVMVYQYEDKVVRSLTFQENESGYWEPVDIYGMGSELGTGKGQARIVKRDLGFDIMYTTTDGNITSGIHFNDDGSIEIDNFSGGVGEAVEQGQTFEGLVLWDTTANTYIYNGTATASNGAEIFNLYPENPYKTSSGKSYFNVATGAYSHAEGFVTEAIGDYSHAEGNQSRALGEASHAEGFSVAVGLNSHSEGTGKAVGNNSHAEGAGTLAVGGSSHAEGLLTTAMSDNSHAEGYDTTASGNYASHAEGNQTTASGDYGAHAEGHNTVASGESSHSSGRDTIASNPYSTAVGCKNSVRKVYNTSSPENEFDLFTVGNGLGTIRSNALRVTGYGTVYSERTMYSSGADYAEYFEWLDGNPDNEDRVGYFVTLKRKKIVKAKNGDYILGIVSGLPCIVGNGDEDWLGKWERDEFNRFIREEVKEPVLDSDGNETGGYTTSWRFKVNPEYDSTKEYIGRKERQEWDAVGMMGVLAVRDDGTCKVDGYARVTNKGTATRAIFHTIGETYRVVERISDNVVEIVFR